MASRFRRSITLAPGVHLNAAGRELHDSIGAPGASDTLGTGGPVSNAGSRDTEISHPAGSARSPRAATGTGERSAGNKDGTISARITLGDDGSVHFLGATGEPLPPRLERLAKAQQSEKIHTWLEGKCQQINALSERLMSIHIATPDPNEPIRYQPRTYDRPGPVAPRPRSAGVLDYVFRARQKRIERDNIQSLLAHTRAHAAWLELKAAFEQEERARRVLYESGRFREPEAMEAVLADRLEAIDWPRETNVSFEIGANGERLFLDVDLPGIEDLPARRATMLGRGLKLILAPLSETEMRKCYLAHVHGVGFRLIGEAFATLPTIGEVILSACWPRADRATGRVQEEYLYSVKVTRDGWSEIDFSNLDRIDIVEALSRFEMRRQMSEAGTFAPIEPYA